MVGRGGVEPPKAMPADLQSAPFDHSGTSPRSSTGSAYTVPTYTLLSCNLMVSSAIIHARRFIAHDLFSLRSWSRRRDSNPRPADYKSAALAN